MTRVIGDNEQWKREEASKVLAHVAGHLATVETAWRTGVPPTGWGLQEVLAYAKHSLALRERLRVTAPELFGDLPTYNYQANIATRNNLLRQMVIDMRGVLATGHHFGLCNEPAALQIDQEQPARARTFVRDHVWEIVVAVIAGGILYLLGWTQ